MINIWKIITMSMSLQFMRVLPLFDHIVYSYIQVVLLLLFFLGKLKVRYSEYHLRRWLSETLPPGENIMVVCVCVCVFSFFSWRALPFIAAGWDLLLRCVESACDRWCLLESTDSDGACRSSGLLHGDLKCVA